MTNEELSKNAIDVALDAHPEGSKAHVKSIIPGFYEGTLVIVTIDSEDAYLGQFNVYFDEINPPTVFDRTADLIKALSIRKPQPKWELTLRKFLSMKRISGLIAIAIAITICVLVLSDRLVPDILSNALTMILGFYFGVQSREKQK